MICSSSKACAHGLSWRKFHLLWHDERSWLFLSLRYLTHRNLTHTNRIKVRMNSRWYTRRHTDLIELCFNWFCLLLETHDWVVHWCVLSVISFLAQSVFKTHANICLIRHWFELGWNASSSNSCWSGCHCCSWGPQWWLVVKGWLILLLHYLSSIFGDRLVWERSWGWSWLGLFSVLVKWMIDLVCHLDWLLADWFLIKACDFWRIFNFGGHLIWLTLEPCWSYRTSELVCWWSCCWAWNTNISFWIRSVHRSGIKLATSHLINCTDTWFELRSNDTWSWNTQTHWWLVTKSWSSIKSSSYWCLLIIQFFIEPCDHLLITFQALKTIF